jgi:hypothetical protein
MSDERIPRRRARGVDASHPVYEVDLWLGGSEPLIWRSLAVPAELTLGSLHDLIQIVVGWEDRHMHRFETRAGRRFEPTDGGESVDAMWSIVFGGGGESEDEAGVTLRDLFEELKDTIGYEYDFGDSWAHGIRLVRTHAEASAFPQLPVCLAGERAGPLEDSGGIWGYQEKVEILRNPDPDNEEHRELLEWVEWIGRKGFDPEAFDLEKVNRRIRSGLRPRPKRPAVRVRRGAGARAYKSRKRKSR